MSTDFLDNIEKVYHPISYIYNYFGDLKLYLGSLYKCHHSKINTKGKIQVAIGQNSLKVPRIPSKASIFYQFNR